MMSLIMVALCSYPQAVFNVTNKSDEFVKEFLITHEKVICIKSNVMRFYVSQNLLVHTM